MKKLNKKMLLSIVAGVLVTVVIIGAGTYAWFTGRANTSGETFKTALVGIETESGVNQAYNFVTDDPTNPNTSNTFKFQQSLEIWANGSADPTAKDLLFYYLKGLYNYVGTERIGVDIGDYDVLKDEFDVLKTAADQAEADVRAKLAALRDAVNDYQKGPLDNAYTQTQIDNYKFLLMMFINGAVNADSTIFEGRLELFFDNYDDLDTTVAPNFYTERFGNEFNAVKDAGTVFTDAKAKVSGHADAVAALVRYEKTDKNLVTPGSFLVGDYSFENTSNIPVYFRVKNTIDAIDNSVVTVLADINNGTTMKLEGFGDYLYCLQPIPADTKIIKIGVIAYIPGEINFDDGTVNPSLMEQEISLNGAEVEIIQATNNAAALSGWTPFVPNP